MISTRRHRLPCCPTHLLAVIETVRPVHGTGGSPIPDEGLQYVGKIEIGKFVQIGTYMCISVHQLAGLFVSISNSPLDLQVAPVRIVPTSRGSSGRVG